MLLCVAFNCSISSRRIPQYNYPLHCWWTFGVFSAFCYCDWMVMSSFVYVLSAHKYVLQLGVYRGRNCWAIGYTMLSTQCCQTIFQSDGKCHSTPLRASGWPVYLPYIISSTLYCLVCLFSATLVDVQMCLLGISHCTLLLIFLGKLCNFFGDVPVQIFGSFECMEILN